MVQYRGRRRELTVLALGNIWVTTERAHKGRDVFKKLNRDVRWEGQRLLDALVPEGRCVDGTAVRRKELGSPETKIADSAHEP